MRRSYSTHPVYKAVTKVIDAVDAHIAVGDAQAAAQPPHIARQIRDRFLLNGIMMLIDPTRHYPSEPILRLYNASLTAARPLLGEAKKLRIVQRNVDKLFGTMETIHRVPLHTLGTPAPIVRVARYLKWSGADNEALLLLGLASQQFVSAKAVWAEQGELMAFMRHATHDAKVEAIMGAATGTALARPTRLPGTLRICEPV